MERNIQCSTCSANQPHGTSQVYRKLLFHFCENCWKRARQRCNEFMLRAAA